jgi:hypothetical protein
MEIGLILVVVTIGSIVLWVIDAVTSAQRDRKIPH